MSRRRGEFEHRTSIFEGAFRAWSHLGGLEPSALETQAASDLDPLTNPIENDPRLASQKRNGDIKGGGAVNPDGSSRREYPYEPLPRAGLAHPYVQAILSPWLGPDADNEAIQLGLTTLRTWWQHRRKGESVSAIAALGTEKMKGVVEGYTRHFFTLAHCLIVNDKEQAPRTLQTKMKELDKVRSKRNKKRAREEEAGKMTAMALSGGLDDSVTAGIAASLADDTLSPLERLHAAQVRRLQDSGGIHASAATAIAGVAPEVSKMKSIDMNGKCMPGKVELPGLADQVTQNAHQLAHQGAGAGSFTGAGAMPSSVPSAPPTQPVQYGDPNTTPVVFVSGNGDIQIAMTIDGITCAHCVKIVETVLRGCNGNRSPIDGLLDAAADRVLNSVLIRIDVASNAKRIAFEAARNLAMVGYTARAREMSIVGAGADKKATMDLGALSTAFEVVASTETKDMFDWSIPCSCPDNGVLRDDCKRHSQMNTSIFEAFDARERQVTEYMAGCGMKYGMPCTCGPNCRCRNCPTHPRGETDSGNCCGQNPADPVPIQAQVADPFRGGGTQQPSFDDQPLHVSEHHPMELFGIEPPGGGGASAAGATMPLPLHRQQQAQPLPPLAGPQQQHRQQQQPQQQQQQHGGHMLHHVRPSYREQAQRNPSVISFGGNLRHMSINSETTFGRAMSGLSALSIDWENLEDFDVDVDHSAHINNSNSPTSHNQTNSNNNSNNINGGPGNNRMGGEPAMGGGSRRSSLRRSYVANSDQDSAHVSFKV